MEGRVYTIDPKEFRVSHVFSTCSIAFKVL
jgi:hypothetical protein